MFNVCTSGPLPKTGQHPHLVDSSHSLTSWTLQQTLTASASSYLQPDSFPSYLYWPLHLAVAADGETNTHSPATMLSLRILFPSKPVPYVLVYRLWGVMGDHHVAQTVHYDILLALFQMRKHWPELAVDTNSSICPSVLSVGHNGGPPHCTDSTLQHTPGVVSDEETLARASSGHQHPLPAAWHTCILLFISSSEPNKYTGFHFLSWEVIMRRHDTCYIEF